MNSMNIKFPNKELPEKGERVAVMVVKEMIYEGNSDNEGSDWIDDGKGFRSVVVWMPLSELYKVKE